jgi:hypothetical protein
MIAISIGFWVARFQRSDHGTQKEPNSERSRGRVARTFLSAKSNAALLA